MLAVTNRGIGCLPPCGGQRGRFVGSSRSGRFRGDQMHLWLVSSYCRAAHRVSPYYVMIPSIAACSTAAGRRQPVPLRLGRSPPRGPPRGCARAPLVALLFLSLAGEHPSLHSFKTSGCVDAGTPTATHEFTLRADRTFPRPRRSSFLRRGDIAARKTSVPVHLAPTTVSPHPTDENRRLALARKAAARCVQSMIYDARTKVASPAAVAEQAGFR